MNEWAEKQIRNAKKHFKNFRAEFKDYGDLQTLDWRDENGSSNYHVHYIFDTKQSYMHISGDLGSACFYLTWEPTFENTHTKLHSLEYIAGKIECSTDKYVYPEEYVRADIEDYYKDCMPQREDKEEYEDDWQYEDAVDEFKEIIESYINAHDYHRGFNAADCDKFEQLEELDCEWWEHNFGEVLAPRLYCWFVGLEMAWEQIEAEKCLVKEELTNNE